MNKEIMNYNVKGLYHGYQEIYFGDSLWYKCFYRNGVLSDYEEYHWDCRLEKRFYI